MNKESVGTKQTHSSNEDSRTASHAQPASQTANIIEAPALLPSGRVLQRPGYDQESGLNLVPPAGVTYGAVSDAPSADEVARARELLRKVVCDVPFAADVHRAAWLAGVLSFFARRAYTGPTPMFLVDAMERGCGTTRLARLAGSICLGKRPLLQVPQGHRAHLEREMIGAVALSGEPMVLIDNITRPFGSEMLDAALTGSAWWHPRKRYEKPAPIPLGMIWWATGCNIRFRGQSGTARRALRIRLDPARVPVARPAGVPLELDAWARANRTDLVWAALTILRGAHLAGAGRLEGLRPWGSFEDWARVVGGALVWMGEPDPYAAAAMHGEAAEGPGDETGT